MGYQLEWCSSLLRALRSDTAYREHGQWPLYLPNIFTFNQLLDIAIAKSANNGLWYLFNDNVVRLAMERDFEEAKRSTYLLFYRKKMAAVI